MRIAVTGGAGYIGSHTALALLDAGHEVLILDSFINAEDDVPGGKTCRHCRTCCAL